MLKWKKIELKLHATFQELCQLEICHQLSVPYVTWKQRSLLNRNSLNFTLFTTGLRKWPGRRSVKYFSFYEYSPVFLSNKLLVSDQTYDISNLKCYGNWKNKVEKDILQEFSLVPKSEQYHTKENKYLQAFCMYYHHHQAMHSAITCEFLFWRNMLCFHRKS